MLGQRQGLHSRNTGERFQEPDRPAYTTIQTTVYRLEAKKAVRRVKKISNAHIFEAVVSRNAAQGRLIDELLGLFGGRTQPVMAHLIESGRLTMDDVKEAEQTLRRLSRKDKTEMIPGAGEPSAAIDDLCGPGRNAHSVPAQQSCADTLLGSG